MRAQYLQDWLADAGRPMTWRLEKERAGSGALGDIGAHIVDLTQHITGDRRHRVTALLETFVTERPVAAAEPGRASPGTVPAGPRRRSPWTTPPRSSRRFGGGAIGVFEATRFATGRKNAIRIEINGSTGSLAFDFEDMNVLQFYDAEEPAATAGFRRILVTEPTTPTSAPGGRRARARLRARLHPPGRRPRHAPSRRDEQPLPSFADGLQVQRVLAAVERSATSGAWEPTD